MNLHSKRIVKITKIDKRGLFGDIQTSTHNYVLCNSNVVIHNSHIAVLLMTVFLKLVPKLVENGYIYRSELPLYGGMNGSKFTPLYNDQELQDFKSKNPNIKIQRYKGLGEMNPGQLYTCLIDNTTRRLTKITSPKDASKIFELMTSSERKRELV